MLKYTLHMLEKLFLKEIILLVLKNRVYQFNKLNTHVLQLIHNIMSV